MESKLKHVSTACINGAHGQCRGEVQIVRTEKCQCECGHAGVPDKPTYQELLESHAEMREALEWYASPRTWNQWAPYTFGDKARAAIAKAAKATERK